MTIREMLEQTEEQILSPHAARSSRSRGRETEESPCTMRTAFQREIGRAHV